MAENGFAFGRPQTSRAQFRQFRPAGTARGLFAAYRGPLDYHVVLGNEHRVDLKQRWLRRLHCASDTGKARAAVIPFSFLQEIVRPIVVCVPA